LKEEKKEVDPGSVQLAQSTSCAELSSASILPGSCSMPFLFRHDNMYLAQQQANKVNIRLII
jgi:hypothetical protein